MYWEIQSPANVRVIELCTQILNLSLGLVAGTAVVECKVAAFDIEVLHYVNPLNTSTT